MKSICSAREFNTQTSFHVMHGFIFESHFGFCELKLIFVDLWMIKALH